MSKIKMSNKKKLIISIVYSIVFLIVIHGILFYCAIKPTFKGDVDKSRLSIVNDSFILPKTCSPVTNYYSAYWVASKIVTEQDPGQRYKWYKDIYVREVYYDKDTDLWLVYIALDIPHILDGDYCCVISGDGKSIYFR